MTMIRENYSELKRVLPTLGVAKGLRCLADTLDKGARFSTSLGMEDQVLTHIIATNNLDIEIFTIDTGRLFQETYDLLDVTRKKYDIAIKTYFPQPGGVENLLSRKGPNSFYESIENRKECCFLRKMEPLNRALSGASAWVTGIRAEQSDTRTQMEMVEWDERHQLIKFNPLLHWTTEQIQDYITEHRIPINTLHKKGYTSIGCAPCTRAILPGEDDRAGRWWWENSTKECGLHETADMEPTENISRSPDGYLDR